MDLNALFLGAKLKSFSRYDIVLKEGDPPTDGLGFVLSGNLLAYKDFFNAKIYLNKIEKSSFFGEIGILTDGNRAATVVADEDNTKIIFINKDIFFMQAIENPSFIMNFINICFQRIRHLQLGLVRSGKIFKFQLSDDIKPLLGIIRNKNQKILNTLQRVTELKIAQGNPICREGEPNKTIYFIKSGLVIIKKFIGVGEIEIGIIEQGDFFGYVDAYNEESYLFSSYSGSSPTIVVPINKDYFFTALKNDAEILYSFFQTLIIHLMQYESAYLEISQTVMVEKLVGKDWNKRR